MCLVATVNTDNNTSTHTHTLYISQIVRSSGYDLENSAITALL